METPRAAAQMWQTSVPPHPTGQNAMWPHLTLTKQDESPFPEMAGVLGVTGRNEQSLEMPSKASQVSELGLGGREGDVGSPVESRSLELRE